MLLNDGKLVLVPTWCIKGGDMSNELHSHNRSSRFTLNLPERMRKELEEKAGMDFISLNSAIIMRLAKSLREERANGC